MIGAFRIEPKTQVNFRNKLVQIVQINFKNMRFILLNSSFYHFHFLHEANKDIIVQKSEICLNAWYPGSDYIILWDFSNLNLEVFMRMVKSWLSGILSKHLMRLQNSYVRCQARTKTSFQICLILSVYWWYWIILSALGFPSDTVTVLYGVYRSLADGETSQIQQL